MRPLTKEDRCDACSAAALTRVQREGSGPLYFCGHHCNRMQYDLSAVGWQLTNDNRPKLKT